MNATRLTTNALTCFLLLSGIGISMQAQDGGLKAQYDAAVQLQSADADEAGSRLQQLSDEAIRLNQPVWVMKAAYSLGILAHNRGDGREALACYARAAQRAHQLDSLSFLVDIWRQKGFLFKNVLHVPDSARHYFERGMNAARAIPYPKGSITCAMGLAFLRMDKAEFVEAMDLLLNARQQAKQLADPVLLTSLASSIGHAYMEVGVLPEAISYFREALSYYDAAHVNAHQLVAHVNLAEALLKSGKVDSAYFQLQRTEPLVVQLRDDPILNAYFNILGEVYFEKGDYQAALAVLDSTRVPDRTRQFIVFTQKARIMLALKDTAQAHHFALEALAVSQHQKNDIQVSLIQRCYEILSVTFAYYRSFEKALFYARLSNEAYRAIYNEKAKNEIFRREFTQRLKMQQQQAALEKQLLANKQRIGQQQIYLLIGLLVILMLGIGLFAYRFVEKHRVNARLEQMVAQRTEELRHKNEMLEEYAFINAHQLRAPIARLLGLCDLFPLYKTIAEKEALIQMINRETADLDAITWAIRDAISKGEPLDRWDLLQYTASRTEEQAGEAGKNDNT